MQLKNLSILSLVAVVLLSLLLVGCAEKAATTTTNPATTISKDQTLALSQDAFSANASITEYVEMLNGGTLTVRLWANPSTGYSWGDAEITHNTVIEQVSRNFEEPTNTKIVGAPGTDVWVFKAIDTGLAIIKISYGRPWESEKLYNLTININVR
jgi:inhibitor of cysteine peptidase